MSVYTTQLRYIVEMECVNQNIPLKGVTENCTNAAAGIFNFNFPIWAESERQWFEVSFLRHFYTQEICAETVGLWKVWLEDWLVTNMPYWNNLILAFNKLSDIDNLLKQLNSETEHYSGDRVEKTDGSSDRDASGNNSNTVENGSTDKYYEVPSSNITDITNHLNNMRQIASNGNMNVNYKDSEGRTYEDNRNMNEGHWRTVTFDNGLNVNDTLQKYMNGLMNVMNKLWDSMEELFMGIY